ncbi:MAG: PIN domain-containing protein [Conexivisphaerales archaeon]
MSVYDTRFFLEYFYSEDKELLERAKWMIENDRDRYISAAVLHETYKLIMDKEGKETAEFRCKIMQKDFTVVE